MRAVFFLFRHEVVDVVANSSSNSSFGATRSSTSRCEKCEWCTCSYSRGRSTCRSSFFELIRFISLVAVLSRRLVVGRCFFLLFHLANFWRFFVHELFWAAPNAGNRHGDTFWPRVASDIFIRIQLESVWNFDILDDNHAFRIRLWRVSFRFRLGFRRELWRQL